MNMRICLYSRNGSRQWTTHEQAWWYRNDISTYDGCAKDEDEYNYLDNHFEKVQEAVKQPLEELETKLRAPMTDGNKTAGEVIDLEEFKKEEMETKVNLELDKFDRPLLDEDSGIELLYNSTILMILSLLMTMMLDSITLCAAN